MGNSLPLPCACYDANGDEAAATSGAEGNSRKTACRNGRAAARHVVPVDMPEELVDGEEDEEGITEAWPGCRVVEPVVGDNGGVRVKIVMKRKEVEELVARLEQRDVAERKVIRMEELDYELGGGDDVAVTMTRPCRDAWRPRLASIPEN